VQGPAIGLILDSYLDRHLPASGFNRDGGFSSMGGAYIASVGDVNDPGGLDSILRLTCDVLVGAWDGDDQLASIILVSKHKTGRRDV
jgi:hypothetical protein